jgi:hypothetical protein
MLIPVDFAASAGGTLWRRTRRAALIAGSFDRSLRARNSNWCLFMAPDDKHPAVELQSTREHVAQGPLIEVDVSLRTVDVGVPQKLRDGFHVARVDQNLASERTAARMA